MKPFLTDAEIKDLILEEKFIQGNLINLFHPKTKKGHLEMDLEIPRADGSHFRIICRKTNKNPLLFSVILGCRVKNSSEIFILKRYDGKDQHTNKIEKNKFYDYHIHTATERYQVQFGNEDGFAEVTNRYADFYEAIRCLEQDCNIVNDSEELGLF